MFISADDHLLNAVRFGCGPRTLVAHGGWVGSWELWQQPFELMQEQWRCIGYDHRGSGASTAPPEDVHLEGLVDDLFAVLDHYEVDRCVLAGESLGAVTVVEAALREPERFIGLVIVDGLIPAGGVTSDHSAVRNAYETYVHHFVDACVPEPKSEHLKRWGRQILLRADPEAAARMLESHDAIETATHLATLTTPTLVIHGSGDVVVPPSSGEAIAAAIPGAEFVVIDGAGHVPTMTRPAEVASAIEAWAARLAG
jgi:pimeloyl-ACP methyl ester carboxylesterase